MISGSAVHSSSAVITFLLFQRVAFLDTENDRCKTPLIPKPHKSLFKDAPRTQHRAGRNPALSPQPARHARPTRSMRHAGPAHTPCASRTTRWVRPQIPHVRSATAARPFFPLRSLVTLNGSALSPPARRNRVGGVGGHGEPARPALGGG